MCYNEVMVARDGKEALNILLRQGRFTRFKGGNPAAAILDLKMSKIDGPEALRRIRAEVALRLLPVIVLASSQQDLDIVEINEMGVNACVVNPVIFDQIVEAISQIGLSGAVLDESPTGRLSRTGRQYSTGKV